MTSRDKLRSSGTVAEIKKCLTVMACLAAVCAKVGVEMKMRRLLSLLVALGLAGLGTVPLSACALAHSRASECAAPQTKTHCARMGMEHAKQPPVTIAKSRKSCCTISQAPLPEVQTWAGSLTVAAPLTFASRAVAAMRPVESAWFPEIAQHSSPPSRQSLLCTFLI